jgi:uncharacterized protein YodC (DUF2158 family)
MAIGLVVGDIVYLLGQGMVDMTVIEYAGDRISKGVSVDVVRCGWFGDDHAFHTQDFREDILVKKR